MSRIGGVGPGNTGLELPSIAAEPVDHGTVEIRHRLMHGVRLGIDLPGVLMRVGDVRNPARCSFRLGAEDYTNVHIISGGGGSCTEWRLRGFRRSSGYMARTSFFVDSVRCCRARSGVRDKGMVFRHLNPTHFLDDHVECFYGHQHPDARVGNAFSDSNHVCQRPGRPPIRNRDNLGLGRSRLLGFRLTLSS